jgi:hypothetical protein
VLKPGGDFVIRDSSLPRPLALRLSFEDRSILTGEGLNDSHALSALTDSHGEGLRSDVLFISPLVTGEAFPMFLNEVSPRILVTGELDPSLVTDDTPLMESLRRIAVFDTSTLGEVTVKSDGGDLSAESYGGEKRVDLK